MTEVIRPNNIFGETMRAIRERSELGRRAFGNHLKGPRPAKANRYYVTRWENGHEKPKGELNLFYNLLFNPAIKGVTSAELRTLASSLEIEQDIGLMSFVFRRFVTLNLAD